MSGPTEEEIAAVSYSPRVTAFDIESAIKEVHYFHPALALPDPNGTPHDHALWTTTFCAIELKSGYVAYGQSTPASAANFNEDIGRRLAYEKAFDQLWPLFGFALKQKLHDVGG
jgi:hypothetical protein